MKKFSLIAVLITCAFAFYSCKKSSSDDTTTTTTVAFQAYVNGTLWTPSAYSATLNYSAANKTKTFSFIAATATGKMLFSMQTASSKIDSGFTVATYTADSIKVKTNYYYLNNGSTISAGSFKAGSIYVTAVDSIGKTITGTFSFNQTKATYDSNGNVTSVTNTAITSGQFNALPYTYVKN